MVRFLVGMALGALACGLLVAVGILFRPSVSFLTPVSPTPTARPLPLLAYSFDRLSQTDMTPSPIELEPLPFSDPSIDRFLFYVTVNGTRVSGISYAPKSSASAPVILMMRGYVPLESYESGVGTDRTAQYLASRGFVTLAPDFMGYGRSASPSADPMEERFQTYTTALTLLSSLPNLPDAFSLIHHPSIPDPSSVGLWGHSNGGHISLALLAITGKDIPTVLWAPVTKPFPYSILYFTDEYEDNGKALRKLVSDFESDYDIDLFDPSQYYDRITAPIQLHQGSDDEAVPEGWSTAFYDLMKSDGKTITYFRYPGENHNFTRGSWPEAAKRTADFFHTKLSNKSKE